MSQRKVQEIKDPTTRTAKRKIYDFYGVDNLRQLKQQLNNNSTLEVLNQGKVAFNNSIKPAPQQFLASMNVPVIDSYGEVINTIEPRTITSLNEYINDIKRFILDWFRQYKFTRTKKDMTFAVINGIKITPENIDTIDFTPFIQTTPVVSAVDTTPILLSVPPIIENCKNSTNILPEEINTAKLCAFNELLSGFRKKGCRSIDELINTALLCSKDTTLYKVDDIGNIIQPPTKLDITRENLLNNGMNTEMLIKICTYLKIKINLFQHVCNKERFRLERITNTIPSERKALNCYVKHNHLYLLSDISITRQYNGIANTNDKGFNNNQGESLNFNGTIVFNDTNKTIGQFLASIPIQPTTIKINNNLLYPFVVNGTKYVYNYDKDLHEHYGDEYVGQSKPSIASSYIQRTPSSFMNSNIFNALSTENVTHRTHADVLRPEYFGEDGLPIEGANIQKYDLNKAYRHAMTNIKTLYTLDITNNIQSCDTLDGVGLYFVEPMTANILHGNNWYSYDILKYALEQGEVFVIKLKLSVKESPNILPDLINEICETFPHHISKEIINDMSGICAIKSKKQISAQLTRSQNKVMDFLEKTRHPYVKYEAELNQFIIGQKKLTNFNSNRLLTYIQILDQFNILLHQRIKDTGGQLLGRYIDAFYVLNPTNEDHLSNEVGNYKPEAFKKIRPHTKERNVIPNHSECIKNILPIDDNQALTIEHLKNGLIICGMGGTGKTHCIKELLKNKKVEYLAPTNLASNLLGGKTLHNFFNIDFTTGIGGCGVSELEYLVIDECSMITSDIWEFIQLFQIKNPQTKIILLGDPHQLPSIEGIKYNFNEVENILRLVNGNICNLNVNYRQDKKGLEACTSIIKTGRFYDWKSSAFNYNAKHITFKNATRRKINSLYSTEGEHILLNDDYASLDDEGREMVDEDGKVIMNETYGYIKEGTQIICNDSHQLDKDTKIFNGQPFIISEVGDDSIITTDGVNIKKSIFSRHYTLNYAITIYKAQGQTYEGQIQIHDMKSMMLNYKFIYTAISRATQYKNISYC